jgi:SAM-dependent methyltransferase
MREVENELVVLSELYADYIRNFDSLNKVRAEQDFMAGDNYFDVGRSAVASIVAGLLSARIHYPKRILDLACGNGRVTRHLALIFPESEITVCDLYPEMVEFCVKTFNAKGAISTEDLNELTFADQFDLIWCGSLLTHCDERLFNGGLQAMRRALATPGVAYAPYTGGGRSRCSGTSGRCARTSCSVLPNAAFIAPASGSPTRSTRGQRSSFL